MTWAGAITALEAILNAQSGFTVQAGEPGVPPRQMLAWWYDGSGDNPLIAETATDHSYGELVKIRAYWSVSNRSAGPSRAIEMTMQTTCRSIIAALMIDRDLGGNCEVVMIEDPTAGWLTIDNGWWRMLTIPITIGFTGLEPIGK